MLTLRARQTSLFDSFRRFLRLLWDGLYKALSRHGQHTWTPTSYSSRVIGLPTIQKRRLLPPPSASEAVEPLIEPCTLFGLAPATHNCVGPLIPSTVAFLAVLLQPDISCNLVSPWYASIFHILELFLKTRHAETIAKFFLPRRPRLGLWWFGIFPFGNPAIFDWIERFLGTLEERYGYGSTSKPDSVMATSALLATMLSLMFMVSPLALITFLGHPLTL